MDSPVNSHLICMSRRVPGQVNKNLSWLTNTKSPRDCSWINPETWASLQIQRLWKTCEEQSCLCLEPVTRFISQPEKRIYLLPGKEYELIGLMVKHSTEGGSGNNFLLYLSELRLECDSHWEKPQVVSSLEKSRLGHLGGTLLCCQLFHLPHPISLSKKSLHLKCKYRVQHK